MHNPKDFEKSIARLLGHIFDSEVKLADIRRLSGGASQETWLISAGSHQLILRRVPKGLSKSGNTTAITMRTEAAIVEAASNAGIKVPKVLYTLKEEDGLGEGFIMDYIKGETIARPILRDPEFASARKTLSWQCGEELAKIHALDTGEFEGISRMSGLAQIDQYEAIYRDIGVSRPIFELALQWLRQTAPQPLPDVLVHGDFRLGNLMVQSAGLAAVLDWELAHIGDPREDLGWICVNSWRFGQTENRVGGFGTIEPMLEAYNQRSGLNLEPDDIDWWEALGIWKWGIMCLIMYEAFRSGSDESVERAAIGRRVSETEIDLINLLERANA